MSGLDPEPDDDAFLAAFEAGTYPFERWDHRAHVRAAYLYARAHGAAGLGRIRAGIQAFNAAHGVATTPTRGYHETLTVAWFRVVAARAGAAASWPAFAAANTDLLEKTALRRYYSVARMTSAEARAGWVEPDLEPLPPAP